MSSGDYAWVCFSSCRSKVWRQSSPLAIGNCTSAVGMVLQQGTMTLYLPFFFFSLNLPSCCPYTFLSLPTFLLNKQPIPNDVFFIGPTSLPKLVFLTALPKQSGPCMVLLCSHLDVNSLGCQDCLLTIWFMLLTFCLL